MNKFLLVVIFLTMSTLVFMAQENNDFYDNTPTKNLAGSLQIEVAGEVANPGVVDLGRLPRRSLITREAQLENGQVAFVGAYRYDGYSLFDILEGKFVDKKNKGEFKPVIDLMVAVENGKGEKVVFSWGEVYYPAALHRIIIADRAAPIVPSESREKWPLPEKIKLVCSNDMITVRNIEAPIRITVFSAPLSLAVVKGIKPLYSPGFKVIAPGSGDGIFTVDEAVEKRTYPSIFYGRGRGFHGVNRFTGLLLKDVLKRFFAMDREFMQRGYLILAGADGYRIAMTCSELFNRNDQAEFLLIDRGENQEGGRYSLYPAQDFFSDRAIKAVQEIHFKKY